MGDRRKYKRYEALLDTLYTRYTGFIKVYSNGDSRNISLGGMSLFVSKLIRKGDELFVEFESPRAKNIIAIAKVAWVDHARSGKNRACGVRFKWAASQAYLSDCVVYFSNSLRNTSANHAA
ncbi:PilZ domain-containing protein [Candidatus Omnitrophota bacterium]